MTAVFMRMIMNKNKKKKLEIKQKAIKLIC